jgi:hypothetical protein
LRAYLQRLPDFDHEEAARLVVDRTAELDGDHYEILSPVADAQTGKYPLASMLILRAVIDFTLTKGRSSRYRHVARHLECASFASAISSFGELETHEAYAGRLKSKHGRKSGFWTLIS